MRTASPVELALIAQRQFDSNRQAALRAADAYKHNPTKENKRIVDERLAAAVYAYNVAKQNGVLLTIPGKEQAVNGSRQLDDLPALRQEPAVGAAASAGSA